MITNHGRPVADLVPTREMAAKVNLFGCIDAPRLAERWDDSQDAAHSEVAELMLGQEGEPSS